MSAKQEFGSEESGPLVPQLCRYLSERSPQPMVAVEGETHVVSYANPAFTRLVGKKRKELIGRPFTEAVPEGVENACKALLDRVYRTGYPALLPEQKHRHSQPQPIYWSYSMWAILGADERPVGVMVQITDATETARFRQHAVEINESLIISAARQHELKGIAETLTAQLQNTVAMRDRFIAIMSHELRNPLATLSSGLELLRLAEGDADTVGSARDMMDRQLKQMVRLVDDLLDVSRITTGKLELHKERVELASIVRAAVEESRAIIDDQGHKLTVSLPSTPVVLAADPVRLTQVFSNLLNNSAKYSERGGEIRLSAEFNRGDIVVRVRDTGIGIPADKFPHIFDAFSQVDTSWKRRQGGMGIGLSLVKEFVELHDGRIEVDSNGETHGTTITIRLPGAEEGKIDSQNMAVSEPVDLTGLRVLVVDDTRFNVFMLRRILETHGCTVVEAFDGEQAIEAATEFQPHAVIMDVGMPNMDGCEAARRIRLEPWGKNILLIAVTGWGQNDDKRRTMAAGFDYHVVKPPDANELRRLLAGAMP